MLFNIVLVEPQIPPNTGNIARLCAGLDGKLHLVKPLGFSTEDRYLKRAGLDYWPHVQLEYHNSLEDLKAIYLKSHFFYFTTKSNRLYTQAKFQEGDFLVFGSETKGLSKKILEENAEHTFTIPMTGKIRSLNLSSAVAMVVGEALRQNNLFHYS
ncbi:MAG: tRNA (uridine(34)/cytosine(34)/5-carboxymethylaminomethyluridine(34)-2'-O)-methyltransferase TrmL [Deltaproteobacteria bacterium RIFCSPLOWO2_12_FULL_40_28]|nr:MAG: tRNA (uridine(34)/cytosine(34)/5-carboxymethylaminomethyluridine(34)-2'-O)-methyltransferase TrmL [Deltaproteobacteria bacterium RIFCSPHIGHO2_02_FULL_40_28]OGQ20807.1 MAG: tRNA (uridine(34)/cytosine(34)/5-carboxymethylaminomethyluridine(34)-2'-O)-methyltransferase TrmL [Deltaproteobacteria bacterium RIFCSPHIGHO2_12_FULL_40_32]OGQ39208.1 MAG: tRNA (uridine(34)/cytosine(34)/5-carboxymethylaminomethyluridine(34)-2'-O)-methyltransferase TrmL [Deltaproteobacteria bacterium RIFCSPLOWO2_02_FULL_